MAFLIVGLALEISLLQITRSLVGAAIGGGLGPAPVAPTISISSGVSDYTPTFSISGDVVNGDTVRLQYSMDSGFIGASEVTAIVVSSIAVFELDPFTDQTWYFRVRTERSGYTVSDWSASVNEGIAALPSAMLVSSPWRPILMPPTSSVRLSELNIGVGLMGSIP